MIFGNHRTDNINFSLLSVEANHDYQVNGMIFIASLIPVYLQLTERGHLPSIPTEQLCT